MICFDGICCGMSVCVIPGIKKNKPVANVSDSENKSRENMTSPDDGESFHTHDMCRLHFILYILQYEKDGKN